jgi:hypothetical protein
MPEYKNQHYVPQFLLRGWSDEDDKVHIYHIQNREEYPKTSISEVCSDSYFYGDPEVEKSLGPLESRHAEIINKIRDGKSIGPLTDNDIRFFAVFVLFQRNRTKQAKEHVVENVDNMAKEVIRTKIEAGEIENKEFGDQTVLEHLDDITIQEENPLARPILMALTGIDQIIDLDIAIIQNKTENGFVISDHPVVHDNRRFKDEYDRFLVGIQSRGLQMFVPLSEEVQVMVYDPAAYFVDYTDESARRVETNSKAVIDGLNDLQLINASQTIYYSNSGRETEFNSANSRLSDYIDADEVAFEHLGPDEHPFDTDNEIIESGRLAYDYSPILPFVKQRLEVEFDVMRNRQVAKQHREFMDEILEDAREEQESE